MIRVIVGLVIVALVGYIAYHRITSAPLSARQTIEAGIEQVMLTTQLEPGQQQLLRVQLSISDYMASHGVPPDSLESLVPKYFDQVPKDPATEEPFEYVRDGSSYRLGAQVTGEPVRVASLPKDQSGEQSETADTEIDLENFVNPNTMELEHFVYDPAGKRNPFQPFDFSQKIKVDESAPPLQRYGLGQLKVTAILTEADGEMTAFVEDVAGIGYPVRVDTKIGTSNGVVVKIEKDRVHVVETIVDFTGEEKKNHVEMKLEPTAGKKGDQGRGRR